MNWRTERYRVERKVKEIGEREREREIWMDMGLYFYWSRLGYASA